MKILPEFLKIKNNNKFFTIFNTFSEKERSEFCEFLQLSFVQKPRLSKIIIYKIQTGTDLNDYLSEKYSKRSLWNIYSELTTSIMQFISFKEILSEKKEMHKLQRKQLNKRDLTKYLVQDYKNEIKHDLDSEFDFESMNNIYKSALNCLVSMFKSSDSKDIDSIFQIYSDYHIMNVFLELLSRRIEYEIRTEIYGKKNFYLYEEVYRFIDFENILMVIYKFYPEYENIFKIIYNLNIVINDPDDYESFQNAKNIFFKNSSQLTDKYKSDILNVFTNICSLITKRTTRNMGSDLFDIMKEKVRLGLINDLIAANKGENHFREYIHVALSVNEISWAEDFLNKYSNLLPFNLRRNSINSALAFIELKKKNYVSAIEYAFMLNRKYYVYDLDFFRILICANFESGNLIECDSAKKRLHEYILRNSRFPQTYKKSAKKFIGCLSKLIKFKETNSKSILAELEYEVKNKSELMWRNWLIYVINESKK